MLTLKKYQKTTLENLRLFLEEARFGNHETAFEKYRTESAKRAAPLAYRPLEKLENTPYVCLRLPTGGGKTLLGAYAIATAAQAFLEQDFPLVLWLVPSNTIRQQTLETLKNPRHPNREAITQKFGHQVLVLDIAEFTQIRPQDIKSKAVILVGTIQTLRVDNTEGRKVYAHHEDLEPHYVNIPKTLEGLEKIEEGAGQGTIKFSFRNLLALHRPLVIIDEAHNATSKLSVEVMQRINPACIIEFTATPATNSNILHSVSASELKAENMIKLPIVLTEHQTWQEAITAAVQTREKLQILAKNGNERDYIRPIVLFQAEDKGHEITYEVVLNYLLENETIDRERIAIATGNQRELDGINLLDPNNKIDFVITVEALKEGWDCPFAYVFCSVATVHSKKDIEQILGRVLRMPYATKRTQEELNRAYAHVSEDSWKNAVPKLQHRMISMGFEAQEANQAIVPQPRLLPEDETGQLPLQPQPVKVILSAQPDLSNFTEEELKQVSTIQLGENEIEYKISGEITPELVEKLILAAPKKDREIVQKTIAIQQAQQPKTPSQRGEKFEVPQLCLFVDGQWEVATKDWFLDPQDWDLLKYPAELSAEEFSIREVANQWLIDVQGKHLTTKFLGSDTLFDLSDAPTNWTVNQLSQELERKIRPPYLRQEVLLEYLRRTLAFLTEKRNIPLSDLARARYILEKQLRDKIKSYYDDAMAKGYQTKLFGAEAAVETNFEIEFSYPTDPFQYPANWYYKGRYVFNKHYYPMIGELESEGEEFECAQAIDRNMAVKCWVRNLSRRDNSFRLPTSSDYFYPDFVALLQDGRTLVVEYKGKPYETNDDSKEKINIGELWEKKSKGKGLFLFAVKRDGKGRDVYKQIEDKISGR